MLTFAASFVYQLYKLNSEPQFMSYPPRNDYSETSARIDTSTGTTMAFAINRFYADKSQVRVKFLGPDAIPIDAVYCSDMYAE